MPPTIADMTRKQLPIGVQSFAKIRADDAFYYVDKTPIAVQLVAQGSYYFLSRPRRFGLEPKPDALCSSDLRRPLLLQFGSTNTPPLPAP